MTRARLPVGLYDEPERYDLTIRALDRDGKPYDPAAGANDPNGDVTIPILNGETGAFHRLRPDANGVARERVEPGEYSAFARVVDDDTFTIAGAPGLDGRADTEYAIDARRAERLRPPRVEGEDTEPRAAVGITYARTSAARGYTEFGFCDAAEVAPGRVHITPTPTARHGAFETTFSGAWSRRAGSGRACPTSTSCCSTIRASAPAVAEPQRTSSPASRRPTGPWGPTASTSPGSSTGRTSPTSPSCRARLRPSRGRSARC